MMKGSVFVMKKILKQILALSLTMTGILQLCVIPNTSAVEVESYSSTVNNIELLNKLGFVSKSYGPKKEDDTVTRGQFANILGCLRGFDENTVNQGTQFMDISSDYWCAGQIYSLCDAGLLDGVSVNTFAPNELITYHQLIKGLVCLLGYDEQAKQLGGYPNGYVSIANNLGIVADSAAEPLNYATVAKLIVKAMDTDIMELKIGSANKLTFSKTKDQTPLTVYHDIYYDTGIMTDNGSTALTADSAVGQKSVVINKKTFGKGDCDVNEYLGYMLKYYYRDIPGDETTLLYAVPYRTDVVKLKDDELDIYNLNYSLKTIYYEDGSRTKHYKIDDYADVIYNGKAYPEFGLDTLKPKQGDMKLVDNDNDGDYDVVSVNEYYDVFISSVDKANEVVFGKYGEKIECDHFDIVEYFTENGKPSTISALDSNQVVSVYESKDGKLAKLVSCGKTLTITVGSVKNGISKPDPANASEVEAFKKQAKETKVLLDDTEYPLSYEYIDAIAAGYQGAVMPESGFTYLFYFDADGRISAVDSPTDYQYAYLLKVYFDEDEEKTFARAFLQNGTITKTEFSKNVKVNGDKYRGQGDSFDAVYRYPDFYDDEGRFVKQAVKLKLNSSGIITELETAREMTTSPYGYDKTKFSLCYEGNAKYNRDQHSINDQYTIWSDIVIFSIPPESDFKEEELAIITEKQLGQGSMPWKLYDCDAAWTAKLAVTQATESTDWEGRLFIAKSVKETLREDGEICKAISGIYAGTEKTFYEYKPNLIPDGIQDGDVCRIVPGVNDKIMNIQVLASPRRGTEPYSGLDGDYDEWRNYYGQIYAGSPMGFTLTFDKGKTIKPFVFNTGTYYMKYDVEKKEYSRGSYTDLYANCPIMEDGTIDLTNSRDMVYVYVRNNWSFGIVILKNALQV